MATRAFVGPELDDQRVNQFLDERPLCAPEAALADVGDFGFRAIESLLRSRLIPTPTTHPNVNGGARFKVRCEPANSLISGGVKGSKVLAGGPPRRHTMVVHTAETGLLQRPYLARAKGIQPSGIVRRSRLRKRPN
jgi:hypothetical protein